MSWPEEDRPEYHSIEIEHLTGLSNLRLQVDFVSASAERLGLDRLTIHDWSATRLRMRGIPLVPEDDSFEAPELWVEVGVFDARPPTGSHVFTTRVGLREEMGLHRALALGPIKAEWWQDGRAGAFNEVDEVREQLELILDGFARLYLAANGPGAKPASIESLPELPSLPAGRQAELESQGREYARRFLRIGPVNLFKVTENSRGVIYALSASVTNTGTDSCSQVNLSYTAPEGWWNYRTGLSMQKPERLEVTGDFWDSERSRRGPLKPLDSVTLGEVVVIPAGTVDPAAFRFVDAICWR